MSKIVKLKDHTFVVLEPVHTVLLDVDGEHIHTQSHFEAGDEVHILPPCFMAESSQLDYHMPLSSDLMSKYGGNKKAYKISRLYFYKYDSDASVFGDRTSVAYELVGLRGFLFSADNFCEYYLNVDFGVTASSSNCCPSESSTSEEFLAAQDTSFEDYSSSALALCLDDSGSSPVMIDYASKRLLSSSAGVSPSDIEYMVSRTQKLLDLQLLDAGSSLRRISRDIDRLLHTYPLDLATLHALRRTQGALQQTYDDLQYAKSRLFGE